MQVKAGRPYDCARAPDKPLSLAKGPTMPDITSIQFPAQNAHSRVQDRYLTMFVKIGDLPALLEADSERAWELQSPVFDSFIRAAEDATDALPRRVTTDLDQVEHQRWTFLAQSAAVETVDGRLQWPVEYGVAHDFEPGDYLSIRKALEAVAADTSKQFGVAVEVVGGEFQVLFQESTSVRLP